MEDAMRTRVVLACGFVAVTCLVPAVTFSQTPQRVPSPALQRSRQVQPSPLIVHEAGRVDVVVKAQGAAALALTPPRVDQSGSIAVQTPPPLSDRGRRDLLTQAAVIIGSAPPPVTGVVTKTTVTPRQPCVPNQACIRSASTADFIPFNEDDPGAQLIELRGGDNPSYLRIFYWPSQTGQPVLVTINLQLFQRTRLSFYGTGFNQDVEMDAGPQTLSLVVTPTSTDAQHLLLTSRGANWRFFSAEFTVLK
jgi:hypothetical protein